ncbi:MAG: phosphoribosylformylglycinamidine cyclo-ligase [Chlamydiales bacterium]|nr:phosphoribosylformylglycinamidine cyclo-ligase [Chlamydiia bacterium]MCP5508492.1 phosphoribosylformylglycinamidine cyclo-ligase [Chlamydiales bacterium]
MTYKDAGVDIDAGNELVKRIKKFAPDIGSFGGLFPLGDNYLVASTDGVGTKLKFANTLGRHETIGIDLVAMCVNDVITTGARPLFFLDYYATAKLDIDSAENVIKGIALGCEEAGCVLLGGETAEMPGFYNTNEYDVSGFAVGVVSKKALIDGTKIKAGDVIVGIPSSGVHSNGFSLIREILHRNETPLSATIDESGVSLGDQLTRPTRIYVNKIHDMIKEAPLKGIAHITGGGLVENIPRILPEKLGIKILKRSWEIPHLFRWLQSVGSIAEKEMYRTFNMGIGMVVIVSSKDADKLCQKFDDLSIIGEVVADEGVSLV